VIKDIHWISKVYRGTNCIHASCFTTMMTKSAFYLNSEHKKYQNDNE